MWTHDEDSFQWCAGCCRFLSQQGVALELIALPAMEDLTRRGPDTVNLERVRRIKTQHQRLTGRVQAVREAIERHLGTLLARDESTV